MQELTKYPWGFDKPEIEYLAGRAVPKVSPLRQHSMVQSALNRILYRLADGRGPVGPEWRFALDAAAPGEVTECLPDVAFVARERLKPLPYAQREKPHFAPDIAIEVRSPSDRVADVEWKMQAYLRSGALVALDVLPDKRAIRAFTNAGERTFLAGEVFECAELPWFNFAVDEAFADIEE